MNRIKEARIAAGFSQKYVALALGVAAPSVSYWESGRNTPTAENYKALSDLLNVSVDYLLGNDVQQKTEEIIKEPANLGELDNDLIQDLMSLNEDEVQRVRDFVAGMRARRVVPSSQNQ